MKKVYSLFMFLLGISFLGFSQEKADLNNLTSGKWQINSIEIENEIMNVANEGHWMVFKSNGTYQINLDQDQQIGSWHLDEKNKIRFDNEASQEESSIMKLNENEFKFSISDYTLVLSKSKESFKNLTSGKWQINTVEIEDEVMNVANEGHWMVFHQDGKYQIMLDQEEQVGTWYLNNKNEIQFDSDSYKGDSFLKKINDKELKLSISGYTLALTK